MSWISDLFKDTGNWLKDTGEQLWENPSRLITGVDPLSTGLWNAILGTDNDPLVSQAGGPSKETRDRIGMTDSSRTWYDVADTIAAIWGGSALAGSGAFGGAAGGSGGAVAGTTEGATTGAVSSSLPSSIAEYGATTNTIGGGFTSADVATGVANSGAAIGPGASSSWMDLLNQLPTGSGGQQQPQSNSSQDSAILSAIKASIMSNPLQDLAKQQMDILGREKRQGGGNGLA